MFAGDLYQLSGESFQLLAENTRSSFIVRDGCTERSLVISSGHAPLPPKVLTELPCATTKFPVKQDLASQVSSSNCPL